MLETIFNWTTTAIGGACEWIVNLALAYLGFDLQLYENVFPLLGQAYEIFRAVGIGLAILFAAVGLAKYQFGELEEQTETPWQILIRTFIAIGLIYVGGHVLVWVINIAKTPYDAMLQLNSTTTFGLPRFTSDSLLSMVPVANVVVASMEFPTSVSTLLSAVITICIAWNLIKLIIEVFERALMVAVMTYSAPLAFSTFATKRSSMILQKWISMFLSQCLLLTLSVWTLKLICNGFDINIANANDTVPYLPRFLFTLGMCKIAQRLDNYLQQLGLNPTTTGGNLLEDVLELSSVFGKFKRRGSNSNVLGAVVDPKGNMYSVAGSQKDVAALFSNYQNGGGTSAESVRGSVVSPSGVRPINTDGTVKKAAEGSTKQRGNKSQAEKNTDTINAAREAQDLRREFDKDGSVSIHGNQGKISNGLNRMYHEEDPVKRETLMETARKNPPVVSEAALFGKQDLGMDEMPEGRVDQKPVKLSTDDLGNEMMKKFTSNTPEFKDMEFQDVRAFTMSDTPQTGIHAGKTIESGRVVTATGVGENGEAYNVQIADSDAWKALKTQISPEEASNWSEMQGPSGANYHVNMAPAMSEETGRYTGAASYTNDEVDSMRPDNGTRPWDSMKKNYTEVQTNHESGNVFIQKARSNSIRFGMSNDSGAINPTASMVRNHQKHRTGSIDDVERGMTTCDIVTSDS